MKSVLVIDMPQKCYECPLMSDDMYCNAYAYIVKGRKLCVEDDVLYGERNYGCPLKYMPRKMAVEHRWYSEDFAKGYNKCIDEIVGEEK